MLSLTKEHLSNVPKLNYFVRIVSIGGGHSTVCNEHSALLCLQCTSIISVYCLLTGGDHRCQSGGFSTAGE